MNRGNSSNILRIVAGAYVMYLAYQMIMSLRAGEVTSNKFIIIAAVVFFIIAGGVIVFFGIRGMIQQSKMSEEEQTDENLNDDLEIEEEEYGMFVEPGLTEGKMKGITEELDKIKNEDAKDIVGKDEDAQKMIHDAENNQE